jgi:CBS domain-containing protein
MTMVHRDASIAYASRLMRAFGTSELQVVSEAGGRPEALGVLTAGDIVTRVLAVGLDPAVLTAGDLVSVSAARRPRPSR